jgi:hypothetical protein
MRVAVGGGFSASLTNRALRVVISRGERRRIGSVGGGSVSFGEAVKIRSSNQSQNLGLK